MPNKTLYKKIIACYNKRMFYLLFITIYSLFFICLSWEKTDWAIYLLVFALPTYLIRFNLGPIPTTLLECMILILFIIWLIKTLKQKNIKTLKQKLLITNYPLPITLFLLAATISMLISPDLRQAAGIWKAYFIEPILFLIVFISTIDKPKLKKVFLFLCFNALILSIFAIYQKFTGSFIPEPHWAATTTRRVTSIFPYPNALALYLAPIIILLIGLIPLLFKKLDLKNYLKITKLQNSYFLLLTSYFLLLTSGLLVIYFTKSKGALLSILISLIFYALFHKPHRRYFIAVLGISFIFLFLYFFISKTQINLQGNPTVEGGGSISTRTQMWSETYEMLKTKPILGAGLVGYQTAVAPFHQKDYIEIYLYPHNIILNFWSEIGLLGLIAFIWIIILFYFQGFETIKQSNLQSKINNSQITNYLPADATALQTGQLPITIMATMTALLIHGLVDVPYFKNDLSILFWLIIGSIIILNKQNNSPEITNN